MDDIIITRSGSRYSILCILGHKIWCLGRYKHLLYNHRVSFFWSVWYVIVIAYGERRLKTSFLAYSDLSRHNIYIGQIVIDA